MIPVTRPFLPPLIEYTEMLESIWQQNILTNDGPLVREFERKMLQHLGVDNFLFLTNGTIALQVAIKALGLKKEVITTPFSYVATTSSLVWEGCTPVFADINPNTLNIDPEQVERAITPRTTGIVATHVYGNPCDIEALQDIADRHHLKIIYDGAHAFGSTYRGKSVFQFGDVSTTSFHATKLLHTIEGGAVTTSSDTLSRTMSFMRNFGHNGPGKFAEVGINGKNSEVHAAMGIVNLKYADEILLRRKQQCQLYDRLLAPLEWKRPETSPASEPNNSYYAIILPTEVETLELERRLNRENIFPRRYFYPGLNELDYVDHHELPVSDSVSRRVLCLPLYYSLANDDIEMISTRMLQAARR